MMLRVHPCDLSWCLQRQTTAFNVVIKLSQSWKSKSSRTLSCGANLELAVELSNGMLSSKPQITVESFYEFVLWATWGEYLWSPLKDVSLWATWEGGLLRGPLRWATQGELLWIPWKCYSLQTVLRIVLPTCQQTRPATVVVELGTSQGIAPRKVGSVLVFFVLVCNRFVTLERTLPNVAPFFPSYSNDRAHYTLLQLQHGLKCMWHLISDLYDFLNYAAKKKVWFKFFFSLRN